MRRRIEEKYPLTALNRSRIVPGVTTHRADIHDFEAIGPAFEGRDYVVHLAASHGAGQTWEDYRPLAAQRVKFDIFYAISGNKWRYRELDHAREVAGFKPLGSAEAYRS